MLLTINSTHEGTKREITSHTFVMSLTKPIVSDQLSEEQLKMQNAFRAALFGAGTEGYSLTLNLAAYYANDPRAKNPTTGEYVPESGLKLAQNDFAVGKSVDLPVTLYEFSIHELTDGKYDVLLNETSGETREMSLIRRAHVSADRATALTYYKASIARQIANGTLTPKVTKPALTGAALAENPE